MSDAPHMVWRDGRHNAVETIEKTVDLIDAPNIIWTPKKATKGQRGGSCKPEVIRFAYSRFNNGPWHADIAIYAQEPGRLCRSVFPPSEVYLPPPWLTELIERAAPTTPAYPDVTT